MSDATIPIPTTPEEIEAYAAAAVDAALDAYDEAIDEALAEQNDAAIAKRRDEDPAGLFEERIVKRMTDEGETRQVATLAVARADTDLYAAMRDAPPAEVTKAGSATADEVIAAAEQVFEAQVLDVMRSNPTLTKQQAALQVARQRPDIYAAMRGVGVASEQGA